MKKYPIDVSIIIRSFNEEKYIEKLICGILKQNISLKYEIILVDSVSTDNTVKIANAIKEFYK